MISPTRASTGRRAWMLTVGAAISLLCLTAGTAAQAIGAKTVAVTGSVAAGELAVEVTGFPDGTVRNSDSQYNIPLTVTNTTDSASTVKVPTSVHVFSTPTTLFQYFRVWPVTNEAECNSDAVPGAGGAFAANAVTGATVTTALAPGEQQPYCVRVLIVSTGGTPTGTTTATLTATATVNLGNFTAANSRSSALTSHSMYVPVYPDPTEWFRIRPQNLPPTLCVSVVGGTSAQVGAGLAMENCLANTPATNGNQRFSFPRLATSDPWVHIKPNVPSGTSLQDSGGVITAQTSNNALTSQHWNIQVVTPGVFQFLNGGLCLTAPDGPGKLTFTECENLASQRFTLGVTTTREAISQTTTDDVRPTEVTEPSIQGTTESQLGSAADCGVLRDDCGADVDEADRNDLPSVPAWFARELEARP